MIKAILFDLDGTLLDTLPDIHKSLNETLRVHGYREITADMKRAYIGNGARELVRRALPEGANEDECFATFTKIFSENDGALTHPFTGVAEGLRRLKAQGYKLGVITNKPHYATVKLIEKFFPDIFDFCMGDDGTFPRKPDPTLARYCALTLRVPCGECLFVGDGETDVLTAKRAQMNMVAVLWGYRSRGVLENAGAVNFINSFSELENFVKNS